MGKTKYKQHDIDDDNRVRSTRTLRHARNIRGQGMRVINALSVDSDLDDDFDSDFDEPKRRQMPNMNKLF